VSEQHCLIRLEKGRNVESGDFVQLLFIADRLIENAPHLDSFIGYEI
jgi:hypothetical protein